MISSGLTINHLPKFIDPRADPARWYGTQVEYEYKVGDQTYISDRLSFREADSPNPQDALKVMNKYRREHEVTVFYDPKNPQEAVLQPGYIGGDFYIILMIGGLLALGGIGIFYSQSLEFSHSRKVGIFSREISIKTKGNSKKLFLRITMPLGLILLPSLVIAAGEDCIFKKKVGIRPLLILIRSSPWPPIMR